jgi:hypothetical protein
MTTPVSAVTGPVEVNPELLQTWLQLGGGRLSREFLRQQGLDPARLASQGFLTVASDRWSVSYVAGPFLVQPPFPPKKANQ